MTWLVGYTANGCENELKEWLAGHSVVAYYAMGRVERFIRNKRKPVMIREPRFRNYIFIRLEDDGVWAKTRMARERGLLVRLIEMAGRAVEVRDSTVTDIMLAEQAGKFDHKPKSFGIILQVGALAEVILGPAIGMTGTVRKANAKRAKVEINGRVLDFAITSLAPA